jgi:hypothetical protein
VGPQVRLIKTQGADTFWWGLGWDFILETVVQGAPTATSKFKQALKLS